MNMIKIKENVKSITIALVVAIVIRSVLFEPFSVPSGSMKPNFLVGDYLFVSKYHYGISRYSFPFGPKIFEGRKFVIAEPKRGDVIVFRGPKNPNIYYIKRLSGLPGDKIKFKKGVLYLNSKKVPRKLTGRFIDTDGKVIDKYLETLPNKFSYDTLDDTPFGYVDNTPTYIVPEGKYFFVGDNRDISRDSRDMSGPIGFVDNEFITGKVVLVLFSNPNPIWKIWQWFLSFDTDRFFKIID